jgi:hydrogenase maturation protein HypF
MDWEPLLPMLLDQSRSRECRAGIFHESLARAITTQVATLAQSEPFEAVGLTGGVFQNRVLAERVIALLSEDGVPTHLPSGIPANDGGLAFGQLIEARARLEGEAI